MSCLMLLAVLFVVQRIFAIIWQYQRLRINPTVRNWVSSHPLLTLWRQCSQFRDQLAVFIEQFLWMVGLQPACQGISVFHIFSVDRNRNLVRTEGTFDWFAIPTLRACPALSGDRKIITGQCGIVVSPVSRACF